MQSGFEKGFDVYYLPPCIDYIIKNTRLIIQDSPTPPTYICVYICVHSFLLFFFSLSLSSFISIILIAKHLSMKTFVIFDEYRYCEIYLEYH